MEDFKCRAEGVVRGTAVGAVGKWHKMREKKRGQTEQALGHGENFVFYSHFSFSLLPGLSV